MFALEESQTQRIFPDFVVYGDYTYTYVRNIGEGTYGIVAEYRFGHHYIALKRTKRTSKDALIAPQTPTPGLLHLLF